MRLILFIEFSLDIIAFITIALLSLAYSITTFQIKKIKNVTKDLFLSILSPGRTIKYPQRKFSRHTENCKYC